MPTSSFLRWPVITALILLIGIFYLLSIPSSCTSYVAGSEHKAVYSESEGKLCMLVSAEDIQKALSKSKKKKMVLNVYPVKKSKGTGKNDFDMVLVYQDAAEIEKNLGSKINAKEFETESASYVSYLKAINFPEGKIPYGYYIEIDSSYIKEPRALSICVFPKVAMMQHCSLPDEEEEGIDSTGKCPPDCCNAYLTAKSSTDTIGKCPPDCLVTLPLYFEKMMKGIIVKEYAVKEVHAYKR